MNSKNMRVKKFIKKKSFELGFDAFGIAKAKPNEDIKHYNEWLSHQYNAGMDYLERHSILKSDTAYVMKSAKSVLCFAVCYNTDYPYSVEPQDNKAKPAYPPKISRYALNKDYHNVLRKKLNTLMKQTKTNFKTDFDYRICIDSAPILERSYAVKAGLGWIGKNACLINKRLGSFVFLAEVLTDLELETDKAYEKSYCGNCRKCIEACPNKAIVDEKQINCHRCLSYLTIEHKGYIDTKLYNPKSARGFIFGCDTCQEVCPWNKDAPITRMSEFMPREEILNLDWERCKNMTEEEFRHIFQNNPVKRTKYKGFMRNIKQLCT